ncbi:MAG TPA: S41 family peptidase [Vicinamibacterales bacterium]|nr:S41 family peptidase [Vicinamibacterales bacterium]
MSTRTRLLLLCVSAPLLAFVLIGGVLGRQASGQEAYPHLRVFEDVVSLIVQNYVEEVDVDRVMEGALRGLADGLDADSAYLAPDQVRAVERGDPLPEGDVGLTLTRRYYLQVVSARDGSPAARAGLRPQDYVRAIDGRPTRDMSVFEGARLLRGAPGSKVTLTVIRGNAADPHQVVLVREKPAAQEVTGRLLEPGLGYVRVPAFDARTAARLRARIAELEKAGAARLIVDLRGTAEGPLDSGLEAARLFVASGTLAIRAARDEARRPIAAAAGDGAIRLPTVLLVNSGTAGAAELFAAALAGNGRAETIGERTRGRAGLQKLVPLPHGRGLWLTWAAYLTPSGEPIHEKGLAPTVEVEEPEEEFGAARSEGAAADPILEKAVARLKATG